MAEPKKAPDWERIETNFRLGVLSLREIAALDGNVTEGAIRKRAKRDDWQRDLSAKVKQRADELVRKAEVRKAVRSERTVAVSEAIEISAVALADVKLGRKSRVVRALALSEKLHGELEAMSDNAPLLAQFGETMRSPDAKGIDRANDTYQAVISFPMRVKAFKDLVDADKALFTMEGDAFSIAAPAADGTGAAGQGPAPDRVADPASYYAWFKAQAPTQ